MKGIVQTNAKIIGNADTGAAVSGIIGRCSGSVPPYTGGYTVIPSADKGTVLETVNKRMTANVTVEKIPYYEVSNSAGGITLVIAGKEKN